MADDAELELFRQGVNCAAVLERLTSGWKLDAAGSTKAALKYRRSAGGIIIVNHDGRGWWDATSTARGDVFSLVQHLDPSLNFGQVRQVLRRFVGISPSFPTAIRDHVRSKVAQTPIERWSRRPRIRPADAAWTYLSGARAIPDTVLHAASTKGCVRLGAYGSAWFAHRLDGQVTHVEIRGPSFKGSLRGGRKTLFAFSGESDTFRRLAVLEAPIDALSLAAIEGVRRDTLYVATGGGMGPGTLEALGSLLAHLATMDGVLVSAADANRAGDRYAERHSELAATASVRFERLRPPDGTDWNDALRRGA